MSLPRFAINKQAIVMGATVLLSLWGLMAFVTAPRREDPEFQIRTCTVMTTWSGAPAEKVEQLITDRIEKAADELDEVDKVTSETRVGISIVYVNLEDDLEDTDAAWEKVRAKVEAVKPELPEGCGEPDVNTDFGDTAVMVLAVHQKPAAQGGRKEHPYTPREMEIIAENIKDEIKLLPTVAKVELHGVQEEVIYLETDVGTWSKLDLTTEELQDLLVRRNIVSPGGSIETEMGRFGVKPSGELEYHEQIMDVTVQSSEGDAPVYLRDLGISLRRAYEEPPALVARYGDNQKTVPSVVISFTMKAGGNVTVLGRLVRKRLAELEGNVIPRDIGIAVVGDQPRSVDICIKDFIANLWQAIVIVVLVAFFLIGFRIAVVMAAAIPIVILSSFGICRFFGVQLEQVSIASLIIALGMLVDNAIEVGDNVHRLLEEGWTRRRAAIVGSEQIAFPVLIATLTTVFAFLPMLTLPGSEGEYMSSLPIVVSTTLMVSWLVAMTTTTLMAFWIMRPTGKHSVSPLVAVINFVKRRIFKKDPAQGKALSERYGVLARACVRHKLLTIIIAGAAFVGACQLLKLVGSQYFPPAQRSEFTIDVRLPNGAAFAQTDEATRQVEEILKELSPQNTSPGEAQRMLRFVSYVGGGGPRFYLNLSPEASSSNYAQIVVNTTGPEASLSLVQDVRREARARVPGTRIVPRLLDMGPGMDSPIAIRILGDDLEALRHYAQQLKQALREVPGTLDVHDTWGAPGYELAVEVDEDRANLAGVSNASIAQTMNAYYSGHYLTTYRQGDHQVPIYLRLPARERRGLRAAREIYVEGSHGKVPLDSVAQLEVKWQPAKINRYRLHRNIEVRSRVREGVLANAVLEQAMPKILAVGEHLPPGYRLEVGGEQEDTSTSQGNMMRCFGIALLLIVMCLVVKYNSFAKPAIILITLPLAATGAFFGLFITGNAMGFMSMLGLVSLAGIVLNDAIVLIEFVETLVKEKVDAGEGLAGPGELSCGGLTREAFHDCLVRGGQMRMLPIILTTLTTVGGLLPLALTGGPLWQPMACVIIFGLIFATFLTLLVVPCLYAVIVEKFKVKVFETSNDEDEGTLPAN